MIRRIRAWRARRRRVRTLRRINAQLRQVLPPPSDAPSREPTVDELRKLIPPLGSLPPLPLPPPGTLPPTTPSRAANPPGLAQD